MQELQDSPGFPDGLKNAKALSLPSQVTFLPHPPNPWGVCYTCSSHSWVWNVSFLNQMLHISGEGRFALPEGARTEARGLCNSNFSDGTTYQETDFTCSWIMIQVWPKSSDFHSCKDQSDKWSRCKRRDVRSLNGITSTHPWKPQPQQYVPCEDRWGDHITQPRYPTCQQGQEGQEVHLCILLHSVTKVSVPPYWKEGKTIVTCLPFMYYQKLYFTQDWPSSGGENKRIILSISRLGTSVLENPKWDTVMKAEWRGLRESPEYKGCGHE